ncbi:3-phytase [Altererythrobacter atlanticus]|nr:phytase [Croceibacterium atlanticum]MBB5732302.1 3-phytase [Croceibacterium atlanticum]
MRKVAIILSLATALAGCATTPTGLPPVAVTASAETVPVGTANADAADDPAVWHNAANPAASLVIGTDKKAGLHVYGLDGASKSFVAAGLVNNVALVETPGHGVIVAASNRDNPVRAAISIYRLDTDRAELNFLGKADGGEGEGYGFCMWQKGDETRAYSALKHGTVIEYRLDLSQAAPRSEKLREMAIPTQIEGCVVDPRDGTLYVGEEAGGIWRFAPDETQGEIVAAVDNRYLVADVEGLALVTDGADGGNLVASSQGDNAYAVFSLPDVTPIGRFRVAEGQFGSTEETDGIELVAGNYGPDFPEGLFVAQDGQNGAEAQNFKLVSWKAIKDALGI